DAEYHVNSALVNRRGIYRDTYGSSAEWTDYQFRPNIPIAMTVAPELFDSEHTLVCLHKMCAVLAAPLGMRTLDPMDMRYRPYYNNSDDSGDALVAQGINYHQGPEWLWLTGYYLRALLQFMRVAVEKKGLEAERALRTVYHELHANMVNLKHHIASSAYAGLPELTNKDGAHCHDSCESQAWSSGCLIIALHEMAQLEVTVHQVLDSHMTSEYNAAQRLLHKIKQSVSEFELNNTGGNTNVVEAAVAQDLQTLSKGIAEYRILGRQESNERKRKTMLDRATSMADDHELLKRRFDKLKLRKNERENYTQERSELFQGGSGVALDTAITVDEDAFWGRSERALDGFIAQGMASLDNLREQRGLLEGTRRRLWNAGGTLGLSKSVITYINRRTAQDKIFLVAGMLLTCLGIYFIVHYFG
ncbi:bifunctional 4-alpha-glucanotransferase/amylo-alpha-1,6-glucosidase, partial [Coemansia sp. S2]